MTMMMSTYTHIRALNLLLNFIVCSSSIGRYIVHIMCVYLCVIRNSTGFNKITANIRNLRNFSFSRANYSYSPDAVCSLNDNSFSLSLVGRAVCSASNEEARAHRLKNKINKTLICQFIKPVADFQIFDNLIIIILPLIRVAAFHCYPFREELCTHSKHTVG